MKSCTVYKRIKHILLISPFICPFFFQINKTVMASDGYRRGYVSFAHCLQYITATGKYLPNRFLANSPSTSSGLRGFKSLDLYNIRSTEYILYHFDHVSWGT